MPQNLRDYEITGPDGRSYTISAAADATDEELIQFVQDNLANTQEAPKTSAPKQASSAAPAAPADVEQDVEAAIMSTYAKRPDPLPQDVANQYAALSADPNVPYSEIVNLLKPYADYVPPSEQEINDFRTRVQANDGEYQKTVSYGTVANQILGNDVPEVDPDTGSDVEAAFKSGLMNNPMNVLETWRQDLFNTDQGDISMDDIKAQYPGLTDDQYEEIHDSVVGERYKRERELAQRTYEQREVNPVLGVTGDLIGGMSPVDLIAPYRGGKLLGTAAEAALNNSAADVLLQTHDLAYGARDKYDMGQTVFAAGAGAVLGGAIHTGVRAVRGDFKGALRKPEQGPAPISVPTNRKNSKQYKEQIVKTAEGIAERINYTARKWDNSPEFSVHTNFRELKGVDNNAIGVYLGVGEDGLAKVAINAERVAEKAKQLKVDPENIVDAVTFHESLGHFGLAKQYGDELDFTLNKWYDDNASFRARTDAWMRKNPGAYANDPDPRARAAEEVLADMSNRGQIPVTLYDTIANVIKGLGRQMGFEIQYSDREIKSILALAHSRVGKDSIAAKISRRADRLVGESTEPRYMYIGEKADLSKDPLSYEGFKETLAKQETYKDSGWTGKDLNILFGNEGISINDAGWFRGPDNRWRKEISDKNAGLKSNPNEWQDNFSRELEQVIDHPELFEKYPDLREVNISSEFRNYGRSSVQGQFSPMQGGLVGTIWVNPKLKGDEAKSVLLHEIQHAVQFIEGHAFGGSPEAALKGLSDEVFFKGARQFEKSLGIELKSLMAQKQMIKYYMDKPAVQRANRSLADWQALTEMGGREGEADKAAKAYEGAVKEILTELGYTPNKDGLYSADVYKQFNQTPVFQHLINTGKWETNGTRMMLLQNFSNKINSTRLLRKGVQSGIKDGSRAYLTRVISKDRDATFEAYQHLYGEYEARDVQARMNMTDRERYNQAPMTSEPGIDPESLSVVDMWGNPVAESASSPRYMKDIELDTKKLSPEDLFESENALDILQNLTRGYEPTHMSIDDIKAEAAARGMTASDLLRKKEMEPGEISRRLAMYDIAAEKMNEKITGLYNKLQSANFTPKDKAEYVKTLAQFQELTARIFDEQSEAGRVLRVLQDLNYTRNKVEGIKDVLGGLQNALDDDETFARFAKELQDSLNKGKDKSKAGGVAVNILNLPRAIMSSLDFSAPFRQGIFLVGTKDFWRAVPQMFKYFFSEESYKALNREIMSRPTYGLMRQGKLSLTDAHGKLSQHEEDFMSAWAEKIPGVARSGRAYSGFLNKVRADTFDSIMEDLRAAGIDPAKNGEAVKSAASFINNATGRGDLGRFNSAAPQLTAGLFSPRLMAARVNMLRPDTYVKLHPVVRKRALKSLAAFGGIATTVLSLAAMSGASVEVDPRSSDFGKIRIGDTRYDVLGGFSQYLTLGSRLSAYLASNVYEGTTGEEGMDHYKTTSTGDTKKYGEGFGSPTALDAAGTFFSNKASPVASFGLDFLRGENAVGEEFDLTSATSQRFLPMFAQDVYEMQQEYGIEKGTAMALPGLFGVGVQNFVPPNIDPEAPVEAPESFEMKDLEDGENDYVKAEGGVVTLKDPAITEWQRRLDIYTKEWMKEEMLKPEWEKMTDKERAKVIAEVRNDARDQAKADMLEVLGLD